MRAKTCSAIAIALAVLAMALTAHETEEKTPTPGFRMETERASAFASDIKTATIRVYPTIVRTPTNTTFSTESQQQIVVLLKEKKVADALKDSNEIKPGALQGHGQFQWCQNDMRAIGDEVQKREINEKYILVLEVLFPPTRGNHISVFGIHCIVLNSKGENVFTFLLNSHHQMFVDANMVANDLSGQSLAELVRKATEVGLEALILQIQQEMPATHE